MSYNILGINPFHHGSVCVLSDGEIVYFLEEERLTRYKADANPFKVILHALSLFKIDEIVIAGINGTEGILTYTNEDPIKSLLRKYHPEIPITVTSHLHHQMHNTHSHFNSGFNQSLGIIMDAGGSLIEGNIEQISVFDNNSISNYSKKIFCEWLPENLNSLSKKIGITPPNLFGYVCKVLGFSGRDNEGKLMGLSSYGNPNNNLPPLYKGIRTNPDIFYMNDLQQSIWESHNSYLLPIKTNGEWIKDPKKITDFEKDLAYKIQTDSQIAVKEYIDELTQKYNTKKIICSGGYFLNCVNNYFLVKELPHLDFYFEPVSNDGGTSIGAAYYRWKTLNPNFQSQKLKSLYLGPKYSKEELLDGIKKYVDTSQ